MIKTLGFFFFNSWAKKLIQSKRFYEISQVVSENSFSIALTFKFSLLFKIILALCRRYVIRHATRLNNKTEMHKNFSQVPYKSHAIIAPSHSTHIKFQIF